MRYMKKIALVFLFAMMLSSCGNKNVIFDESVVIPNASWDNQELPYFDVNVEDTLSPYSFYFNIRHLENYRYSNFYMFMHTTFPDGNQTHDTVEIVLAYLDGRWVGRGSGSMRDNNILLNDNLHFPLKGNYRFEIEQAMREEVLNGIVDVGVCFEKNRN